MIKTQTINLEMEGKLLINSDNVPYICTEAKRESFATIIASKIEEFETKNVRIKCNFSIELIEDKK